MPLHPPLLLSFLTTCFPTIHRSGYTYWLYYSARMKTIDGANMHVSRQINMNKNPKILNKPKTDTKIKVNYHVCSQDA